MKRKRKRLFLLWTVSALFLSLIVNATAINTPWIDLPSDGEQGEPQLSGEDSAEIGTGKKAEESTVGENDPAEVEFDFWGEDTEFEVKSETTAGTQTKADTAQLAETLEKKGCGSMIPQNGVIALILIFGITNVIFLVRKEQHDGSAN